MLTVQRLIQTASENGIVLFLDGDVLKITFRGQPHQCLLAMIESCKAEIIEALKARTLKTDRREKMVPVMEKLI